MADLTAATRKKLPKLDRGKISRDEYDRIVAKANKVMAREKK